MVASYWFSSSGRCPQRENVNFEFESVRIERDILIMYNETIVVQRIDCGKRELTLERLNILVYNEHVTLSFSETRLGF